MGIWDRFFGKKSPTASAEPPTSAEHVKSSGQKITPVGQTTDSDAFLKHITSLFGQENVIRKIDSTKTGLPPVCCFIYHDLPEPGMTTAVTYGLSVANHPNWKFGKPELILTVKSANESWAMAMTYFADQFRGEKPFSYGNLFTLDEPICSESEMCGFFVFAPAILHQDKLKMVVPTKTINIVGMHPIYSGEAALIQKIGLEQFLHLPEFNRIDMCDVKRPDMSKRST
jgi:hypothetical protein